MSPESLTNKEESGTNRKAATTATTPAEVVVEAPKCPRCDSSNTKFCYYNNYSLTQPRHFCKACKRYWTKGGALRNIPVGGACRKNKKINTKFSNPSRFISSISTRDHDHFKYLASNSSSLCLNNNNNNNNNNLPSIFHNSLSNNQQYDQLTSYFGTNNNDLMGTDNISTFPLSSSSSSFIHDKQDHTNGLLFLQDHNIATNISNYNVDAASSIESLNCINQDLHWKLQQERLAMLLSDKKQEDSSKQDTNELFFNGNNTKYYSGAMNLSNDPSSSTSNGMTVAWCNLYQYMPLP